MSLKTSDTHLSQYSKQVWDRFDKTSSANLRDGKLWVIMKFKLGRNKWLNVVKLDRI